MRPAGPGLRGLLRLRMRNTENSTRDCCRAYPAFWVCAHRFCESLPPGFRRVSGGVHRGDGGILSGKEDGPLPCYDERIIWGLCIGKIKSWTEAEPHIRAFVPAIDSWAVCDLICGSLKAAEKYQAEAWNLFSPILNRKRNMRSALGWLCFSPIL